MPKAKANEDVKRPIRFYIGVDVHTYNDQRPMRLQCVVEAESVEAALPLAAAECVRRLRSGETFVV